MVSEPTVTAFATDEPDSMPNIAEPNTLTFAGPPAAVAAKQKQTSKALQYESYQQRRDKK